jgi:uncharacterized repeat protein (TIGR01451 family)
MIAVRWICASALLALSSSLFASTVEGITVSHFEPLQRMSLHRGGVAQQKLQPAESVNLRFDAMGRAFDLELEPNSRLLNNARSGLAADVGVYRGHLANAPDSWTRIVIANGEPRGLIWDGNELFAVEAAEDGLLAVDGPVIYRLADVTVQAGQMSCGSTSFASNGNAVYKTIVRELSVMMQKGPGAAEEITLGAIGDFEFTNAQGANAATAIATRINNIDGIYSQQLAIQITAETVETYPNSSDPFTDQTDSGMLLDELSAYRLITPAQSQQGLTHLFTGKNLDGSTAGVAFVGALCSTRFGAGLAEATRGATLDSLISAHEIGHNFGADHDGDPAESCPNEPPTFIMAASVGINNNTFSPCSIGVMQAEAAAASCITPLPGVDMTIGTNGQPASVLLGNAINVTFNLDNNGTTGATGVAATVALPNNVTFLAASASQGSCTNNAPNVNCTLGDIAGSSTGNVTVTTTSDAVGPAVFSAIVSSDADDDAGNNQTVQQVNVESAVDLVANVTPAVQVALNQSANVVSTLENESPVAATGVTVSITLDAGLRADTATWTAGPCTVAARQVDCSASTLSGQSMSTLTIGLTGITAGTQGYTITMAANEAEAAPANNVVSGSVNVGTGGGGSGSNDDDGGGAAGLLFLSLLGGLVARRRYPRPAR